MLLLGAFRWVQVCLLKVKTDKMSFFVTAAVVVAIAAVRSTNFVKKIVCVEKKLIKSTAPKDFLAK